MIAAVLPHASEDPYLPTINCVRLELDGDRFLAAATDRYSLAVCRASLEGWEEDAPPVEALTASLRTDDVKRLFAFLRPQRRDVAHWTLTDESLTVAVNSGPTLTVRTVEAENFPNWRAILGEVTGRESEPGTQMGFTPRIVDHFHKSAKVLGEVGMTWGFVSPLKPVVVRIGADFVGLLMPCRVSDSLPELDLAAFGIESPKAVTAA